jgi:hypothetical protein
MAFLKNAGRFSDGGNVSCLRRVALLSPLSLPQFMLCAVNANLRWGLREGSCNNIIPGFIAGSTEHQGSALE